MTGAGGNILLWDMVWGAGPVVKLVLLVLLAMSVLTWAIIFYKISMLRKAEKESTSFYNLFIKSSEPQQILSVAKNYEFTPFSRLVSDVFTAIRSSVTGASLNRVIQKRIENERVWFERSVQFLATTANTAPFIGLFGTVWGIMNTFRSIGLKGAANLAVVAPGIAEALIATAMGLFAAIPAVIGYNHLQSRIERLMQATESFSVDLLVKLSEKQQRGE
ncbi:MAG TPA: Tol-Pal system subunit TolQ [Deltaproteobacteria bacterium]|nr:Tol-Pal system subunit TolQ [Deltaproteobacteria bacterium]